MAESVHYPFCNDILNIGCVVLQCNEARCQDGHQTVRRKERGRGGVEHHELHSSKLLPLPSHSHLSCSSANAGLAVTHAPSTSLRLAEPDSDWRRPRPPRIAGPYSGGSIPDVCMVFTMCFKVARLLKMATVELARYTILSIIMS